MTEARGATNGLVVVDKPEGPTSFDVVHRARKAFDTRTIGHTGTLDPLASGVLVVLVGTWTRLQSHLTADDKRYLARIQFGSRTSTDDRAGEVVQTGDASSLTRARVADALQTLVGRQQQVPPAHSAIHIDGERAYAKARRGEQVEMQPREIVVHALTLLDFVERDALAVVDVRCGKGTYVRALARDLGERLGVPAHLGALQRTESGPYTLADAVALDTLAPAQLRRDLNAIRGIHTIAISNDDARVLMTGRRVPTKEPDVAIAIVHVDGHPVSLVRVERGELVVERGL